MIDFSKPSPDDNLNNKAVHYEAPFLFLFFGTTKCILFDTGATKDEPAHFPLRQTVDGLVADWLNKYGPSRDEQNDDNYELIVAHTHLHKDHFEGDAQFEGRPHTTIVGKSYEETVQFYGFQNWPNDESIVSDLGGGCALSILATTGHEDAEVSVWDPYTRLLLTGDLVLPGRLYVRDWDAFRESIARLVRFSENHEISHVLGCHIEMSRYPREE